MALQHHEFQLCLRDAEKLRLYVQLRLSDQEILNASLKKAQLNARRWELEAKEAVDRAAWAEAERDAARHEAMARLETDAEGSARAQMESELARIQCTLIASEGVRLKWSLNLTLFSKPWLSRGRPVGRRRRR